METISNNPFQESFQMDDDSPMEVFDSLEIQEDVEGMLYKKNLHQFLILLVLCN